MISIYARRELYTLQEICSSAGISYVDQVWAMRYPVPDRGPSSAWPFVRAEFKPKQKLRVAK